MKVMSVVGARPQFVKLSPLSRELRKYHKELIVHTGQHYNNEMSSKFFEDLDIPLPDYNLMIGGGTHGEQTGKMLIDIEKVVLNEKPDMLITFGDTNTTLAAALVGVKLGVQVVHIEAGLRSFNKAMPEEVNRIVADHTSDVLFAPTETAMRNLKLEGLESKSHLTGDIMVDTLAMSIPRSINSSVVQKFNLKPNDYYLLTLHRPYNVDDPGVLNQILLELGELKKQIVFPVHPRTKKMITTHQLVINKNILMIDPQGYLDFIALQLNSYMIITDSGGIQKEAYILKKPCITLRSETEWIETVKFQWNLLINRSEYRSFHEIIERFTPGEQYHKLFGENVAETMVEIIGKK